MQWVFCKSVARHMTFKNNYKIAIDNHMIVWYNPIILKDREVLTMKWTLPGTVLTIRREDADRVDMQFSAMFLAGGMVLSQVSSITGLEPYMIQNWVKRGFLPPPTMKRYSLRQLCRILNINMLRGALPMEDICRLLEYVNGHLDDESDDLIDDSLLYFMFVRLAALAKPETPQEDWQRLLDRVLSGYQEPVPGAKQRIETVLKIMLAAWFSAQLRRYAESLLAPLKETAPSAG